MATSLTPEQRSQRARIAALARWAKETPAANAARGQSGLLEKFRQQVLAEDPSLAEPELSRRAEAARRLHMQRLAFKSSRARSKIRAAEAELSELDAPEDGEAA